MNLLTTTERVGATFQLPVPGQSSPLLCTVGQGGGGAAQNVLTVETPVRLDNTAPTAILTSTGLFPPPSSTYLAHVELNLILEVALAASVNFTTFLLVSAAWGSDPSNARSGAQQVYCRTPLEAFGNPYHFELPIFLDSVIGTPPTSDASLFLRFVATLGTPDAVVSIAGAAGLLTSRVRLEDVPMVGAGSLV